MRIVKDVIIVILMERNTVDHGTMANHQELDLVENVGALLGFDVIIIEENINELNENMVMKYVCSFLPLIGDDVLVRAPGLEPGTP